MRAPALARLGGTQTLGSAPLLLRDAVAAWGWNPPSSVAQLATSFFEKDYLFFFVVYFSAVL